MTKKISAQESKTIDLLKFSLVFLIVFVHMMPDTTSLASADFPLFSSRGFSNVLAIGITYILAQVAVPTYFLISGYLFGAGLEDWNWDIFANKIKRRSKTLLLPYILWNVISISSFVTFLLFNDIKDGSSLANVTEYLKGIGLSGFWDYCIWGGDKINWLGMATPNSGPFVISLWFVRDLMVVILFVPVLFWIFRKTKIWGLLLLLFCYISKIWPQIHGLSIDAFFFFGLGLYLSMNGRTLVEETERFKIPALVISSISFLILVYYGGVKTQEGRFIFPFFAVCCLCLYVKTASYFVVRNKVELLTLLIQSTFFVYLLHACPFPEITSITALINTSVYRIVVHFSAPWVLYYIVSPILIVAFCILVYWILQKISPTLCRVLSGGRVPKAQQTS